MSHRLRLFHATVCLYTSFVGIRMLLIGSSSAKTPNWHKIILWALCWTELLPNSARTEKTVRAGGEKITKGSLGKWGKNAYPYVFRSNKELWNYIYQEQQRNSNTKTASAFVMLPWPPIIWALSGLIMALKQCVRRSNSLLLRLSCSRKKHQREILVSALFKVLLKNLS